MSVIPSIILSAVLACGGATANTGDIMNVINNSKNMEITCTEDVQKIVDNLKNIEVNVNDKALKNFLAGFIKNNHTQPTAQPTEVPEPTQAPTAKPTQKPVVKPTQAPTAKPTQKPVVKPTQVPTAKPTQKPVVKPTQAPTAKPSDTSAYISEVVRLVNQHRAANGLSSLTLDETLTAAAQKRAVETSTSFSHTRPNGSKFSTVLGEYGISYRYSGENIAYGQSSPQEVVTAWMNSAGHRANILGSNYNKIGVGCYKRGSTYYWSQLFTN